MAEGMKKGVRVDIIGKNLQGTIAYIGSTMFASGKWIGVILDVPKGKNDGSVQGKRYFECGENYGVFVRQQHINVLGSDSGHSRPPEQQTVGSLKTPKAIPKGKRRSIKMSSSESRLSRTPSPSQLPAPSASQSKISGLSTPSTLDKSITKSGISPPRTQKSSSATSAQPDRGDTMEIKMTSQEQVQAPPPSALSNISALAGGVSMAEVEMLKAQLKDWKDKFETIRLKRQADREKLKDLEKLKLQVQHLGEFKTRMSEQNQDILKQLRDAKKEAKEALESKDHYMEEMSDVHETVEMATLDKEMAEEKVESLQQEVETLTEKVEELQTDLEIMKAEIEDKGTDGAASSYQLKQLEEQNTRLKEALLRMRDLSAAEKTEHQSLEKVMDKRSKELSDAQKKNEKLAEELEKAESTIDELKEQVDVALVAEEMVEELTDKNLQLEEKVADFEEQVHDLETMNEMNEELQENARENEMELREEVDLAKSKMREADRKAEAANEVVNDYQDTIKKFRKLVQELQEANVELRQQQSGDEKSSEAETPTPAPAFNYQIKMVETKAAARSIDLDLRKLEAQQANDHVRYLSMFMPGLFSKRGGDGDCVQVMLLVQRISRKAEIIAKHVNDRFEISTPMDKASDYNGVRGEQLTFASGLVSILQRLQTLMDRYEMSLGQCSIDLFQKIGTLNLEMAPHERVLDFLAEQLRRDALDETTNIDQLNKAVDFFKHLYSVHMSKEPFLDCWKLLDDHVKQSNAFLQNIQCNTSRMKSFLKSGQEMSDAATLLRDIETASSDIKQFCKKLRRRMPQPPDVTSDKVSINNLPMLKYSKETANRITESEENLLKIALTLSSAIEQCTSGSSSDKNEMLHHEMQEMFGKASRTVFTNGSGGFDDVRLAIGNVMATMNYLVTSLQEGEFDTVEKRPKSHTDLLFEIQALSGQVTPPVEKRALAIKAEITDSEGLASKLGDKDLVIQELRKSLKLKAAEIGETKIRIGMLERKLEKSGKVGEEQLSRLQQENDNMKEELKKKEREYDETLDTLQHDIDTLEYEKSELKQRLIAQSKRSLIDVKSDVGRGSPSSKSNIASILAGAATASGETPGTQVIVEDSPLMQEQVKALQIALQAKHAENFRLLGKNMFDRLNKLKPVNVQKRMKIDKQDESVTELRKLHVNLDNLKEHIISISCPKVVDISKKKPGSLLEGSKSPAQQLQQEQIRLQIAKEKVVELQIKACQLMALRKTGNYTQRQFASFPTSDFTRSLKTSDPVSVGSLSLPINSSQRPGSELTRTRLVLDPHELVKLHNTVIQAYS